MKRFFTFLTFFFILTFAHSQLNFPGEGKYGSISTFGEDLIYVMVNNGMFYTSSDGALNWTENNTGISEDFFDMLFFDEDLGFAVGTNGSILKTMDAGQNWALISSGTTEDLFSIAMISLNNIWIVGREGTVLHSVDAGNNWTMVDGLSSEQLNSVAFNGAYGYIAGNNGTLLFTTDYGATWAPVSLSTANDLFSISMTENNTQILAGQANEEYVEYFANEIYKTEDNNNWINYNVPYIMDMGISCAYFVNDSMGFYLDVAAALCNCSYLQLYKTTDAGQTWEISFSTEYIGLTFLGGFSDLAFANDSIGYAYVNSKLFKTSNGGTDWIALSVKEIDINSFAVYPNPSEGNKLNLQFPTNDPTDFLVEIINLQGKQVLSMAKNENGPIDIISLEEGFYFLNIWKEGRIVGTKKFIKN